MAYIVEVRVQPKECGKWHNVRIISHSKRKFTVYFDDMGLIANHIPWYRRLWRALKETFRREKFSGAINTYSHMEGGDESDSTRN